MRRGLTADRAVLVALGLLLAAGIGLRAALVQAKSAAFLGYFDSLLYLGAARDNLFDDPGRPAGYPIFLRLLHALDPSIALTVLVQHAFGIATALLLFLTVRRVVPAGWALVPTAVVLLAGPQLFLEHAALSESLFTVLLAATAYCAVRSLGERPFPWAALAGLFGGLATCVRSVGTLLPVVVVLWLVAATSGGWRERLRMGGIAVFVTWLVVVAYVVPARHVAGYVGPGLTRAGGLNLYAGVMGFADCSRFTPPDGTRGLCDKRPPSKRPGPFYYGQYDESPVARVFGSLPGIRPEQNAKLSAFARTAILHQPFDYLGNVGRDLARFWSSDIRYDPFAGESYDRLSALLADDYPKTVRLAGRWYGTVGGAEHEGTLSTLRDYERHTRLEGVPLVLLALLALAGLPLARGPRLAVGLLMLALAAATLVAPVALSFFDVRFAIPGYGALAAAGAIGAASLWERGAARRAARRLHQAPLSAVGDQSR